MELVQLSTQYEAKKVGQTVVINTGHPYSFSNSKANLHQTHVVLHYDFIHHFLCFDLPKHGLASSIYVSISQTDRSYLKHLYDYLRRDYIHIYLNRFQNVIRSC